MGRVHGEKHRRIHELRSQGMPVKEIAASMNIPLKTVEGHLYYERDQAWRKRRKMVKEMYRGPIRVGDVFVNRGLKAKAFVFGVEADMIELRIYDGVNASKDNPARFVMLLGDFRREWRCREVNPLGTLLVRALAS